jgi:LmbE family N-acetylglucosaminyl deacetylase
MRFFRRAAAWVLILACGVPRAAKTQERGAVALAELIDGLAVTTRVLMIGAHPDDEDTRLITWLSRGRHVETAYLSLTRGDGGQNLIGNELGEALGAIRSEELLSARRVDGAHQFFTRAYDFGFSKDSAEALRHWPRAELLGDIVAVVRQFRPHVIVSVFSGTSRDGHGQHQVAGLLAQEAFAAAVDSARYPRATHGAPWSAKKLYRATFFDPQSGTFRYNVGEYDPLLGRSYAEIAAESRSQHRSQAFGTLQRKGAAISSVRRLASRVNAQVPAEQERSLFEGIDTTLFRLVSESCGRPRARVDSLAAAVAGAARAYDARDPAPSRRALAGVQRMLGTLSPGGRPQCAGDGENDAEASLRTFGRRLDRALLIAAGVAVEAEVPREIVALGDSTSATVRVFNRGPSPVVVRRAGDREAGVTVAPDSVASLTVPFRAPVRSTPFWLEQPRRTDFYSSDGALQRAPADSARRDSSVPLQIAVEGATAGVAAPVVFRYADPVKGDLSRPLAFAPAVSMTLDAYAGYARAGTPLSREVRVTLRSADTKPRDVVVSLDLPKGLTVDSATRSVTMPAYDAVRTIVFTVHGQLPVGRARITARATSNGQTFANGYQLIDYDHIRPIRIYRDATLDLESVDVKLPAEASVAYVQGVGDNSAPVLRQLGIRVTMLDPATIPSTSLRQFSAIVVGPRAYESSEALVANNAQLLEYVRKGGTMVVQYGQTEMQNAGIMPYPITLSRPADRVTDEASPVQITDPASKVLRGPNRITQGDFDGWLQDRSLYMPRTFDARYAAPLATHDPNEPDNRGAVLVAPLGEGTYVYTTLAFFRQLPAAVPGAARLFVNLIDAKPDQAPKKVTP